MLKKLLNGIIIITLLIVFALRFRYKEPKFIFLEVSADFGFISLILFISNAVLLAYLVYKATTKNRSYNLSKIVEKLQTLLENAYHKRSNNKYWKIAFNICYDLCWGMPVLLPKIVIYITRFLFIFALLFDVFVLEYFFYCYKAIYLYLLIYLLKILLKIATLNNKNIRVLLKKSIIYTKIEKEKNTFSRELSKENLILNSTEEYDILERLTAQFETKLEIMEKSMELPWQIQLLIRSTHLVVWGYILYFYPFPIIGLLGNIIFLNVILPTKLHLIVLIAAGIYLFYHKKK